MCPQPPPLQAPEEAQESETRPAASIQELLDIVAQVEAPEFLVASICHHLAGRIERGSEQDLRAIGASIGTILAAMRRFPDSPVVQLHAITVVVHLVNQTVYEHFGDYQTNAAAAIEDGVLSFCVELIQKESSAALLVGTCCLVFANIASSCAFHDAGHESDIMKSLLHAMQRYPDVLPVVKNACGAILIMTHGFAAAEKYRIAVHVYGGLELIMLVMRRHPTDLEMQLVGIGALCHSSYRAQAVLAIHAGGGTELVRTAMEAHANSRKLQFNACNFIRSMACLEELEPPIGSPAIVQGILKAMKKFPRDATLQRSACAALWNVSHTASKKLVFEQGAIEVVLQTMTNHKQSDEVQTHAIGFLWNMAVVEELRVELAIAGAVELIAEAMETHREAEGLQREAIGAFYLLTKAKDKQVRIALTTSNAIPALKYQFRKLNSAMMNGEFEFKDIMVFEKLTNALEQLGVMENYAIGDGDYDADDDEGEQPNESPPFDIGDLLAKDLATDAPGWYVSRKFHVDLDRSLELEKDLGQSTFFRMMNKPKVGQIVCIRIVLPYGGRGHIYGTVKTVSPTPTDEEMKKSDCDLYDKGCDCGSPSCLLKNGTREEILSGLGALHGQEVTTSVSLGREHLDSRKLRFAPLPEFFRGEGAFYTMVVRFNCNERSWNVVRIEEQNNDKDGVDK